MSETPPDITPVADPEPVVEPEPVIDLYSDFPPFGEDLRDADNNPIVIWDFTNSLRIQYLSDGTTATRPFTDTELSLVAAKLADQTALQTEQDLIAKGQQALSANRAWLSRTTTPTNAQSLAQIDRLTKQMNALILLQNRDFSDTSGT